jgi:ribulose-5-phosphate 4-epimerase/fuculose-1-phosphate aldolase
MTPDSAAHDTRGQGQYLDERRKLAVMCRVAGDLGYIGEFGHISYRVPETEIVLITPGAGAEKSTVTADQIFVFDLQGNLLFHPRGFIVPFESPIHTRIHRDRPEVGCVAHLHAHNSTLLGIVDQPIVPVINQAFYLHEGIPTWDDPSLVVRDDQAGELSAALGDSVACQMRGHGSVVVGETPEIGLMNCYMIEQNAGYQIAATELGGAVPFDPEIVVATARFRTALKAEIAGALWGYFEGRALQNGLPL